MNGFLRKNRCATERLLTHLRRTSRGKAIRVYYIRRFPPGKRIVVMMIPIGHLTLGTIRKACTPYRERPYPPRVMNDRHGPCLRLTCHFPSVRSDETGRLLKKAKKAAGWAEREFGMPAIVSSIKGLIEARRRLHAF